jgi:tRNA threonylcarbamoyladenosine biosynthesis protein TsaE
VHPPLGDGPALVHVDAYRLGGAAELDDLDLDTDLDLAVTVVEWGEGLAETLAEDRLVVALTRDAEGGSETRQVNVTALGPRWFDTRLAAALAPALA